MERLTYRDQMTGSLYLTPAAEMMDWDGFVAVLIGRLARYGDTGLDPGEIEALKLYAMGKATAQIKEIDGISLSRVRDLSTADKRGTLLILDEDMALALCAGATAIRHSGMQLFEIGGADQRSISASTAARLLSDAGEKALRGGPCA